MTSFPSATKLKGGPFDGQIRLIDTSQERLTLPVSSRLAETMCDAMSDLPSGAEFTAVYVRQVGAEPISYRFLKLTPS